MKAASGHARKALPSERIHWDGLHAPDVPGAAPPSPVADMQDALGLPPGSGAPPSRDADMYYHMDIPSVSLEFPRFRADVLQPAASAAPDAASAASPVLPVS